MTESEHPTTLIAALLGAVGLALISVKMLGPQPEPAPPNAYRCAGVRLLLCESGPEFLTVGVVIVLITVLTSGTATRLWRGR